MKYKKNNNLFIML